MEFDQILISIISGLSSSILTIFCSWIIFKRKFSYEKTYSLRVDLYKEFIDYNFEFLNELFLYLTKFRTQQTKLPFSLLLAYNQKSHQLARKLSLFSSPATFHLSIEVIQMIYEVGAGIDETSVWFDIKPAQEEFKIMNRMYLLMNQMRKDLYLKKLTKEWIKTQEDIKKNGYNVKKFVP